MTEGIEQPNREKIRTLGKKMKLTSSREYWKQTTAGMNEKIKKEYLRRRIKLR